MEIGRVCVLGWYFFLGHTHVCGEHREVQELDRHARVVVVVVGWEPEFIACALGFKLNAVERKPPGAMHISRILGWCVPLTRKAPVHSCIFLAYLLHHVVEESFILFAWFIGITTLFLEEGIAFGVLPALVEVSQ